MRRNSSGTAAVFCILLLTGCGGLDQQKALLKGPPFDLNVWLKNPEEGTAAIFDRNGNQVEAAAIRRTCVQPTQDLNWNCNVNIQYFYAPGIETYQENWRIVYSEMEIAAVEIRRGDAKLSGEVRGYVLWLQGRALLPREAEKSSSADLRLFRQPDNSVLETDTYATLGIRVGSIITRWTKK